jgi:hypothetical protein
MAKKPIRHMTYRHVKAMHACTDGWQWWHDAFGERGLNLTNVKRAQEQVAAAMAKTMRTGPRKGETLADRYNSEWGMWIISAFSYRCNMDVWSIGVAYNNTSAGGGSYTVAQRKLVRFIVKVLCEAAKSQPGWKK